MSQESELTKKFIVVSHDVDLARVMWKRGDYASEVLAIVRRAERRLSEVRQRLEIHVGD